MNELSIPMKLEAVINEYDYKKENVKNELKAYNEAADLLKKNATIQGTWGNTNIDTGYIHESTLLESLKKSAWKHVYNMLQIDRIATANDKRDFERSMSHPPEFTFDNIVASFGEYIKSPKENILRGLAETFGNLDPYYKSHEKMKIGVKGLPKRVIISGVNCYAYGYGWDKIKDVISALAAYQGKPLPEHSDINDLNKDDEALKEKYGVWLKRFKNGNAHLFFGAKALLDINRGLAEYYGDVLPDCHEEVKEKQSSTAVSKDLQYYPTPVNVVKNIIDNYIYVRQGDKVLEPSCGCGRFLDYLKEKGATSIGYEFDAGRVSEARAKGHTVIQANFLEMPPKEEFDYVVMNPPFYGKHYAKHIQHAFKFLKQGGTLVAVLPVTARYDHGLVDGTWHDLPVGSFKESGTNVNTTILKMYKR